MSWDIFLYESDRGDKPVAEFILQQSKQAQAKINHLIHLLEKYGNQLGIPQSKMLKNGVYELRIRGKEEVRIIYCFKQSKIYLLHGFKKQTQKTPQKEILIALQRMQKMD